MIIMTLCDSCMRNLNEAGYSVKKIAHRTTTEKAKICEQCHKHFHAIALNQYIVEVKRKER